jgi:hypothetical protein
MRRGFLEETDGNDHKVRRRRRDIEAEFLYFERDLLRETVRRELYGEMEG